MKLLLDVGNTRIKWAHLDGRSLVDRGAVRHRGVGVADWIRKLPAGGHPTEIIASNVAGDVVARGLSTWARRTYGLSVRFPRAEAAGGAVRNAYTVPELLGVDRWLAMIGVRRDCPESFLVVAAGTAFTVDLVDETGQHLGGLIVPGRSMMIDSLKKGTGNIAAAAGAASARNSGIFGLNTSGAITSGASHALAGLVAEAIREGVCRCGNLHLFVHGGDGGDVFDIVAMQCASQLPAGVEMVQDAVLAGLAVIASNGETR
jgi:type III pantothenate kinase